MDTKILFEAAREGKVDVLSRLLLENPLILADMRLASLAESVVHVATKSGQLNFVHELMKLDPDIAREMNRDGFRALDIAVVMGNLPIVRNILSFDGDLGRLTGRDNRSALHYAAAKGRVEIICELLSHSPDGIQDITVHGETALHLAVKHYQLEAFAELVKWVERLSKGSIINIQDGDGNTVLHLAVSTKQYMCVNLLLDEKCFMRGRVEVNVRNSKGLTALDISDIVIQDCYDGKVRGVLQDAGAQHSSDQVVETNSQQPIQINNDDNDLQSSEPTASSIWDHFEYFKFKMDRDSPSDTRNAMLVVAALIATVTFQAGVSPPSGLFDMSHRLNSTNQRPLGVSAYTDDFIFLFANTSGFTASILIIYYLTIGFPMYRELYVSLFSMSLTYGTSFVLIIRGAKVERNIQTLAYVLPSIAFFLIYFMRWHTLLRKSAWNCTRRRALRNDRLPIGN